jgi:glycosyltransferase involved in cell wall biosynthesis
MALSGDTEGVISIGIVTPSYNQGRFLEETIDSVLSQGYPHLQYVIIDGGSTDESVKIIRKHEQHLAFWVSEKDFGQSHAINKGLRHLRTDVWAYLNSDDTYLPETFVKVAAAFLDRGVKWVTGRGTYVDVTGRRVKEMIPVRDWTVDSVLENLIANPVVMAVQVANFMRRSIVEEFGYFNESLHYCMDVEYGLRPLLSGIRPLVIDELLAKARLHPESKTVIQNANGEFARESAEILEGLLRTGEGRCHREAVLSALRNYRRQEALAYVWRTWRSAGRLSGLVAWTHVVANDPSLVAHRPALGLLRRVVSGPG